MKKIIYAIMCTVLATALRAGEHSRHASIARRTTSCLPEIVLEYKQESESELLERKWRYQKGMPLRSKRTLAYHVLENHHDTIIAVAPKKHLIDELSWDDLELFHHSDTTASSLLALIDRTSLQLSYAALSFLLAHPIDNAAALAERQTIIRTLTENNHLYELLNEKYKQLTPNEGAFLSLWQEDVIEKGLKSLISIPGFGVFDNHELTSGISILANTSVCALILGTSLYGLTLTPYYFFAKNRAPAVLEAQTTEDIKRRKEKFEIHSEDAPFFANLIKTSAIVSSLPLQWTAFNGGKKFLTEQVLHLRLAHEKLATISNFLNTVIVIGKELTNNRELLNRLAFAETWEKIATQKNLSSSLSYLFSLFATTTLNSSFSLISHWGRIAYTYSHAKACRPELEEFCAAVAELGAYLSIATLLKENSGSDSAHYSLATFVERDKPYINVHHVWNPSISAEKAVMHSFSCGEGDVNVIIITGPNMAGKSTVMKETVLAALMAQTLTIAPAGFIELTPLSFFGSYLNIDDNTAKGYSLFKHQVMRVQTLLKKINALDPHTYGLLIFDEPFSGTSHQESSLLAKSLALELAEKKQTLSMIATHDITLNQLEKENTSFINYKVEATVMDNGALFFPRTFLPGSSTQNIALHILKTEGFSDSMLNKAYALAEA